MSLNPLMYNDEILCILRDSEKMDSYHLTYGESELKDENIVKSIENKYFNEKKK